MNLGCADALRRKSTHKPISLEVYIRKWAYERVFRSRGLEANPRLASNRTRAILTCRQDTMTLVWFAIFISRALMSGDRAKPGSRAGGKSSDIDKPSEAATPTFVC